MLTTLLAIATLAAPVQEPIEFQLGWKKGDKFTYTVSTGNKQRVMADGTVDISVTDDTEKGFTVSTGRVVFGESSGFPMRPIPAGFLKFSRDGKVIVERVFDERSGTVGTYFMFVALPTKPVSIGQEFQVTMDFKGTSAKFTGKLISLEGEKKNLAKFEFDGSFYGADGLTAPIQLATTFDTSRKIYVSHSASWHNGGIVHSFKLKELSK